MINESKIQEFVENADYARTDIMTVIIDMKGICEMLISVEQRLKDQISSYDYEKKLDNKKVIMDSIKTYAEYYMGDLIEFCEKLNEYNEYVSDISLANIKIPEYIDERDMIAFRAEELVNEFKNVYEQLLSNFEVFFNEPKRKTIGNIQNMIENELNIEELFLNIEENSQSIIDELDTMCEKVENLIKRNSNKR